MCVYMGGADDSVARETPDREESIFTPGGCLIYLLLVCVFIVVDVFCVS